MFTKEKVIDINNINSTLNFINNESDIMFKGEIMMYATNLYLTYDECCYLLEHAYLINSINNLKQLINFIDKWKVIIDDINKALDNNTIGDYLSNFKGVHVMLSIFGFTREGIELTDKGNLLLSEINKQIEKEEAELDELAKSILSRQCLTVLHVLLRLRR